MASHIQGFDKERFASTVNRNLICLICINVLKDPVLCPRNHDCLCRDCMGHIDHFHIIMNEDIFCKDDIGTRKPVSISSDDL